MSNCVSGESVGLVEDDSEREGWTHRLDRLVRLEAFALCRRARAREPKQVRGLGRRRGAAKERVDGPYMKRTSLSDLPARWQ